jgi:uncharacterized DUF497 family protein
VHRDFEWDEDKAASNLVKHGVSFEKAALALVLTGNFGPTESRLGGV